MSVISAHARTVCTRPSLPPRGRPGNEATLDHTACVMHMNTNVLPCHPGTKLLGTSVVHWSTIHKPLGSVEPVPQQYGSFSPDNVNKYIIFAGA